MCRQLETISLSRQKRLSKDNRRRNKVGSKHNNAEVNNALRRVSTDTVFHVDFVSMLTPRRGPCKMRTWFENGHREILYTHCRILNVRTTI